MSAGYYVLRPDSLTVDDRAIEIRLGLPWYRGLPWCALTRLQISIDGRPIGDGRVKVDGLAVDELSQRDSYWPLTHRARVRLSVPDGLVQRGQSLDLAVTGTLAIPSPVSPDGSPMRVEFESSQRLLAG